MLNKPISTKQFELLAELELLPDTFSFLGSMAPIDETEDKASIITELVSMGVLVDKNELDPEFKDIVDRMRDPDESYRGTLSLLNKRQPFKYETPEYFWDKVFLLDIPQVHIFICLSGTKVIMCVRAGDFITFTVKKINKGTKLSEIAAPFIQAVSNPTGEFTPANISISLPAKELTEYYVVPSLTGEEPEDILKDGYKMNQMRELSVGAETIRAYQALEKLPLLAKLSLVHSNHNKEITQGTSAVFSFYDGNIETITWQEVNPSGYKWVKIKGATTKNVVEALDALKSADHAQLRLPTW